MAYSLAGFNGQRPDPVSGHYHLGNGYRACSPALGRFTAPDNWSPFGAGGINPYAYCADDPVNRADPSGHFSAGQGIGMALGFVAGIALSILTEGAAMPVALTLMATVAGDAAIGAGAELATEAIDGQRISWGQVGIAAGLSAGASLVGLGVGKGISKAFRGMKNISSVVNGAAYSAEQVNAWDRVATRGLGEGQLRGGANEAEEYIRDPKKFTHETEKFTVSSVDEAAGLNANDEPANQFFNKKKAKKWTFIGNFREDRNVPYHADDVFYHQYDMVKSRLGNAMPEIIKRESVLNAETNRMTEGKIGESLFNSFFETPNGKSTRRIMNHYGLTAREVVRRASDTEGQYDYLIYLNPVQG